MEILRREVFGEATSTPAERRRMARLGIQVNRRIAEALVEQGIIDPSGKTRQELQHEIQTRIRALLQDGFEPGASVVIDYRDDLLHEARRFVRRRQYSFALLFYATYFEHWINYRIGTALNRQGFTNEQIAHFMQGVGDVRRKDLLLRVLGAPSISDHVVGVVMQVAERRNAYVHYKWTPKPLDARSDEQVSQERLLKSAEKAVARLRHIDNRPFEAKNGSFSRRCQGVRSRGRTRRCKKCIDTFGRRERSQRPAK